VDADFLVTAQRQHQIDVVGPPFGSYSWQHQIAHGYDLQAFVLDWEAQPAHCPQGHTSVKWTPGHDVSGDPVFRIRFDWAACRACPTRQVCTTAKDAPRQLTVRPQVHHEAIQAARQRQETPAFKTQYALRSGGGEQPLARHPALSSPPESLPRLSADTPPTTPHGRGDECRAGDRLAPR
jgi:transposase